jgi:hypothetical protein
MVGGGLVGLCNFGKFGCIWCASQPLCQSKLTGKRASAGQCCAFSSVPKAPYALGVPRAAACLDAQYHVRVWGFCHFERLHTYSGHQCTAFGESSALWVSLLRATHRSLSILLSPHPSIWGLVGLQERPY